MAKASLRPRKRAKPGLALPIQAETAVQVAQIRLRRAQDVLSALAYCADQDAELSLGPIALWQRGI